MKTYYFVQANLKQLRTWRNYTQAYVAQQMKISQQTYQKLESGQREMTVSEMLRIAEILEIPCTELLKEKQTQLLPSTSPIAGEILERLIQFREMEGKALIELAALIGK